MPLTRAFFRREQDMLVVILQRDDSTTFLTEVRGGTWNVQYYARGAAKNRASLDLLNSWNADVWVLTETHDDLDLSTSHVAIHSEQRCPTPGGRWTTIWTSFPLIERIPTAGGAGELIIYGTVLPWNGDTGLDPTRPARGWDEFYRVVPLQGHKWASLRNRYPGATLIVAGDLNQDLGGRHYYGTKACRTLLRTQLGTASLDCLTTTDRFGPGSLQHPPIDHVCAGPGRDTSFTTKPCGRNNDVNGVRLSDHGGTLVSLETEPRSTSVRTGTS
jgi:hypothetical protein